MTVGLVEGFRSYRSGGDGTSEEDCDCDPRFEEGRLVVDGTDCEGGGDLAANEACRRTAVDAQADIPPVYADSSLYVGRTFGGVTALVLDGLRAFADGYANPWLYPLVYDRLPTPSLYVTADPLVPFLAVTAALAVFTVDRVVVTGEGSTGSVLAGGSLAGA